MAHKKKSEPPEEPPPEKVVVPLAPAGGRVPTRGERTTAHVFSAISLDGEWPWRFSPVFNGHTFHLFLLALVAHFAGRKVFLVIDNGSCHWLDDAGKAWLAANGDNLELHRLPPYSPEFVRLLACVGDEVVGAEAVAIAVAVPGAGGAGFLGGVGDARSSLGIFARSDRSWPRKDER